MIRSLGAAALSAAIVVSFVAPSLSAAEKDWPAWRGPFGNGIAPPEQRPPTAWSEDENIVWKTAVAGRGHSSPIVVGQRVLLTTADEASQVQAVICFDRKSGKPLWQTVVNEGGFPDEIHTKNTHASPTLAHSSGRLFAAFYNNDAIQLAALDLNGEILWQRQAAPFVPQQYKYGYAASPAVYEESVIVAADYPGEGSSLAAFDQASGRQLWRTARPDLTSYSSPVVARLAGPGQLLLGGWDQVAGYDPATGRQLWSAAGPADATCGTMVWDDDVVFASGGYPQRETLAVRADGSADVVWRNREKCYEQSLLAYDGHIYAINNTGIAFCWNAKTGEQVWSVRLTGPNSASPVLAGGNIYLTNEKGRTYVFRADPREFQLLARNQLGEEAFASPAVVDGQLFFRVAAGAGEERRETLYCIGKAGAE